jgi:hypothetical protein
MALRNLIISEKDCMDSISRIQAKMDAIKNSPSQAEHWKQLVRERASWIKRLNEIRAKS